MEYQVKKKKYETEIRSNYLGIRGKMKLFIKYIGFEKIKKDNNMKGLRIVKIIESPKLNKRYRVVLSNGDIFDFGDTGSNTYIDHHNEERRRRYWLRHYGNIREQHLISNLIPSPSLFSALLLWGRSTSLRENIIELNRRLEDKYGSTL